MNNRQPWTREEDAELRRLVATRARSADIGAALGRTKSAVDNRRVKLGAHRWRKLPQSRRQRVGELLALESGLSSTALADRLGCSRTTATRYRIALGLPKLTRSAAARAANVTRAARRNPTDPTPSEHRVLDLLASAGPLSPHEIADRLEASYVVTTAHLYSLRRKGHAFAEGKSGRGKAGASGTRWLALNWWLAANDRLIRHAASKVWQRNKCVEFEELVSAVVIACAKCVSKFKPRGVKFSTYAIKVARFDATAFAMNEKRRGVRVPSNLTFDASVGPAVGSLEALAAAGRSGEPFEITAPVAENVPPMDPMFWEKVVVGLSARSAAMLLGFYRDGRTLGDLAREIGRSKQRVEQLVRQAEQKIRERRSLAEYEEAA